MIRSVTAAISREFRRLNQLTLVVLLIVLLLLTVGSFLLFVVWFDHDTVAWFRMTLLATVVLLVVGALALYTLQRTRGRILRNSSLAIIADLHELQAANKRADALQAMASTLSATLSFERVVEQALGVCSLTLEDMGIPQDSLVGAVLLYDGQALVPLARQRFLAADDGRTLSGEAGIVAEALREAEPAVTDDPTKDPELGLFQTFADCFTVVCVPLRAGYRLYGVMILGTETAVRFEADHFQLFDAVADQTVIALQNAELYQRLEAEKRRLIEADEEARQRLARDLHDGPTQKVATIAMRLSALRQIAADQPERIASELEKLETLAMQTSGDLRGMLFTLRPLLIESKGLGAAIEALLNDVASDALQTSIEGGEYGRRLDDQTQRVVFAVVEEAVSNVRKHAQASHITVRLWLEEDCLLASVADDGVGFDAHSVAAGYEERGSFGLLNMRERAERLDGSLRIDSRPGGGTEVTLLVPLATNGRSVEEEAASSPLLS